MTSNMEITLLIITTSLLWTNADITISSSLRCPANTFTATSTSQYLCKDDPTWKHEEYSGHDLPWHRHTYSQTSWECQAGIPVVVGAEHGWILSPNYGISPYPTDVVCIWQISVDPLMVVEYWIDWISLLFPDHIVVYYPTAKNSQTPYAIFDGHRPGSRRTGGSARMDVVFYSDQMGSDLGFKLRFKAVPAIVPTADSPCTGEGAMQVHITDDVTKIYSPDYVGNGMPRVGNDVTCQWKLVAPPEKTLVLDFEMLWLEASTDLCSYDYLEFRDGTLDYNTDESILTGCGVDRTAAEPVTLTSTSRFILVTFRTDSEIESVGFALNVFTVNDTTPVVECGGELSGSGNFSSPGYPFYYYNDLECIWTIIVPERMVIELHVTDFLLEGTVDDCTSKDYLSFMDPFFQQQPMAILCGDHTEDITIVSTAHLITILFKSDSSIGYRGFTVDFTPVDLAASRCTPAGQDLELTYGFLTPHFGLLTSQMTCLTYTWNIVSTEYFLDVLLLPFAAPLCTDGMFSITMNGNLASYCDIDVQQVIPLGMAAGVVQVQLRVHDLATVTSSFYLYFRPATEQISALACGAETQPLPYYSRDIDEGMRLVFPKDNICSIAIIPQPGQFVEFTIESMISSSLDCIQGNITVYDGSRGNPFPIICAPMLGSTTYTASSVDGLLIEFYMLLSPLTITATFKSVETLGIPGRLHPLCTDDPTPAPLRVGHQVNLSIEPMETEEFCYSWLIQVDENQRAVIKYNTLRVDDVMYGCWYSNIQFYSVEEDGTKSLLRQMCGNLDGFKLESPTRQLFIYLQSAIGYRTVQMEAEVAVNSTEVSDCGVMMTYDTPGSFDIPSSYPVNTECRYQITAPTDELIEVTLTNLDIENGFRCMYDSVRFYDGGDTSGKLIRSQCGQKDSPIVFHSLTHQMTAVFVSDGSVTGGGATVTFTFINANSVPWLQCGVPSVQPRIIGGSPITPDRIPWQVALVALSLAVHPGCGGTIIDPRTILTAAHCVVDVPPGVLQVFAGLSDWTDLSDADNIQEMIIAETHVHPEYSAVTLGNDVAVLILAEDLVYGNRVSAGCLPTSQVPAGTNCLVTGWGNTQFAGDSSPELLVLELPLMDRETCREFYPEVNDEHLCGGWRGHSPCHGDSGGPLVCQNPDSSAWELHGIVSYGDVCGENDEPAVFVNVLTAMQDPWLANLLRHV